MSMIPPIATLPLPMEDDSAEILDIKLSSYLYVVYIGKSLASATCSSPRQGDTKEPETRAMDEMKPHEREYYEAWQNGGRLALPSINWETDRGRTPTSKKSLKKANRRAEALNRIYNTEKADLSHYACFAENHPLWIPLITAVERVVGAEKDEKEIFRRAQERSHDGQTVQKIARTTLRILCRSEESPAKLSVLEKIRLLQSSLQSKERRSDGSLGKRKHREGEGQVLGGEYQAAARSRAYIPDSSWSVIRSTLAQRPKPS